MTNLESQSLIKKQLESTPDDLLNQFDQGSFCDELKNMENLWYSKFKDIPFGNSLYQEINFVVGARLTPGRAYRQIGLRAQELLVNLRDAWYKYKLNSLHIKKLQQKIASTDDELDREIFSVKIDQKSGENLIQKKLIRDAIVSLQFMFSVLELFPEYSGEKFEAEEAVHFQINFDRQLNNIVGAIEGKRNMFIDTDLLIENLENPMNIFLDHTQRLSANLMHSPKTDLIERL